MALLYFGPLGNFVCACSRVSVRGVKASDEDRSESVQNSFDDRHVVKGVVFEFYFVEVAYYVPPCYEKKGFEAIGRW